MDPPILETNCREADGCFWPAREHGIFVDQNDFVYLGGNGEDGGARQQQPALATYPWEAPFGDDSHILKFTADGKFVYQIGAAGREGPDSEKIDGGPNGTPQPYLPADMSVHAATNRLYIADGYGNRRILIADATTGQYVGHFGAYGQNPVTDDPSSGVADTDVGPWIEDYQAGRMKPLFFRGPVHCATVSRDGFLYVCDRGNNRVQIFDLGSAELGKPCANPNAEPGKCGFVREVHVAPQTASRHVRQRDAVHRSRAELPLRRRSLEQHALHHQPRESDGARPHRSARPPGRRVPLAPRARRRFGRQYLHGRSGQRPARAEVSALRVCELQRHRQRRSRPLQ